jgi:hypothetical protein
VNKEKRSNNQDRNMNIHMCLTEQATIWLMEQNENQNPQEQYM